MEIDEEQMDALYLWGNKVGLWSIGEFNASSFSPITDCNKQYHNHRWVISAKNVKITDRLFLTFMLFPPIGDRNRTQANTPLIHSI